MTLLAALDIVCVTAANPGPLTLSGTNTWIVGRDPAFVVDPGPALASHMAAVDARLDHRGGLGGIAVTHDHGDHVEAVPTLLSRWGAVPVAGGREGWDVRLAEGDSFGPLTSLPVPGHASDHVALIRGGAAFTGDAVLGEGSVFVGPGPGAMAGYLAGLRRLRAMGLDVLCPGHGPAVADPAAKLDSYLAHRLDRERRLVDALARGRRTVDELLDDAWPDVPAVLRRAAELTLGAHLDKLAEEGRLPEGVQRSAPQPPGAA